MDKFFKEYVNEIKELVVNDISKALNKIQDLLSDASLLYNEVILIKGRLQDLETKSRKGIVNHEDEEVSRNSILNSTIEIISKISLSDTKNIQKPNTDTMYLINFIQENTELNVKLEEYKKEIAILKKELQKKSEELEVIQDQESKDIKENLTETNPHIKELTDFKKKYWSTFNYFPKLYDRLSTTTNEKYYDELEAQLVLGVLNRNTNQFKNLKRFKSCFDEIKRIQIKNNFFMTTEFEATKKINQFEAFRRKFDITDFEEIGLKLLEAEKLKDYLYDKGFFSN